MAFELPVSTSGIPAYVLNRSHHDFNERDRTLLLLMKPLLVEAYQKLEERIRFRQAILMLDDVAERSKRGAVLVTREGMIE